MKEIFLAGGCFWGAQAYLKALNGALETQVGYANGNTENPTYEQVCTHTTGFTEAVRVGYEPGVLALPGLLDYFFDSIDPTSMNQQGGDIGDQYRTGIYFSDPADEAVVRRALRALEEKIGKPVAIECEPFRNFYPAEEVHQDYLDKNPNGYCHIPRTKIEQVYKDSRRA